MKKPVWDKILKVVIAIASAIVGSTERQCNECIEIWGEYPLMKRAGNKKFRHVSFLKYHLLMLFSQQIIHRLYRIERTQRNFYKHRIPIAHGTVPQTGKFKCF